MTGPADGDDRATGAGSTPDSYRDYAAGVTDPRFTEWLRRRAEPAWREATEHRFARKVGAGEIGDEAFRRYLVQDYAFVERLVGAFGHAVGQAPTMAAKATLVDFLGTLTDDENDYFERSFAALGVSETASEDPALTTATRAFENLLARASREGGYAETLAVLVPAEWVYLSWASDVADRAEDGPDRFYLAEWVDLHSVPAFAAFVDWLRRELDREGAAASERRQRTLERLFTRAVDLEVAFFDAAYDPQYGVASADAGGERRW